MPYMPIFGVVSQKKLILDWVFISESSQQEQGDMYLDVWCDGDVDCIRSELNAEYPAFDEGPGMTCSVTDYSVQMYYIFEVKYV